MVPGGSPSTVPLLSVRGHAGSLGSLSHRIGEETTVLIAGFPAGAFAANCYVVAPAAGEECVIIDPGQDAQPGIEEILAEHRLKPAAVLLTHGHLDHVWSVAPVCGAKDIPAYIHPADRMLLSDPAKGFPLGMGQELFGGLTFTEPDDVLELTDGATLNLVGLSIVVDHAPGHTQGSVTFRVPQPGPEGRSPSPGVPGGMAPPGQGVTGGSPAVEILFSGDLLFAGSIGRTDLPGGDYAVILRSLAKTLRLGDETVVLSGHGPQTTIGTERHSNPFLAGLSEAGPGDEGGSVRPVTRGL
jgi:glyoxylase-like metal-dependent hydrolase (beta-lactamase superfamily II)